MHQGAAYYLSLKQAILFIKDGWNLKSQVEFSFKLKLFDVFKKNVNYN